MDKYDDDAFENGVLRDGARHRVPMYMRDGKSPMITDGTDDPFCLHRPGWRIASGGSERDARAPRQSAQGDRRSARRVFGSTH